VGARSAAGKVLHLCLELLAEATNETHAGVLIDTNKRVCVLASAGTEVQLQASTIPPTHPNHKHTSTPTCWVQAQPLQVSEWPHAKQPQAELGACALRLGLCQHHLDLVGGQLCEGRKGRGREGGERQQRQAQVSHTGSASITLTL
jgi:hypothetical protein